MKLPCVCASFRTDVWMCDDDEEVEGEVRGPKMDGARGAAVLFRVPRGGCCWLLEQYDCANLLNGKRCYWDWNMCISGPVVPSPIRMYRYWGASCCLTGSSELWLHIIPNCMVSEWCASQECMVRVVRRFCSVFRGVGAVVGWNSQTVSNLLNGKRFYWGWNVCISGPVVPSPIRICRY